VSRKSDDRIVERGDFAKLRLAVEYLPLADPTHPENETRAHSRAQLRKVARGIAEHGFVVPVTVYGDEVVATGNARVRAAKLAGLTEVPVIRLEHLSEEQARLFAIADNKLLEGGEWNSDASSIEFAAIAIAAPSIDLGRSGFTIGAARTCWSAPYQ
jgi:ParB-like chromosome segregation protein Spo0J